MSLFKPAWQKDNFEKAKKAVDKLTDDRQLLEVVLHGNSCVQRYALGKITDHCVLEEVESLVTKTSYLHMQACSQLGHQWRGCECTRCSKTRDEQHQWDKCICTVCRKKSDDRQKHQWEVLNDSPYGESRMGSYKATRRSPFEIKCAHCGKRERITSGEICLHCLTPATMIPEKMQEDDGEAHSISKRRITCSNCGHTFSYEINE